MESYDVVVVGTGVAGLMSAMKLARSGMRVLVLEKAETIGSGSSTRNVGWLHSGAYHAGTIADANDAIIVSKQCSYGYDQIRTHYPEVLDDGLVESNVLVRNHNILPELERRWSRAGVHARRLTISEAKAEHPQADLSSLAAVYDVRDVSLNTRLLYRRLVAEAKIHGVEFKMGVSLRSNDGEILEFASRTGHQAKVKTKSTVYASGFSTGELVKSLHQVEFPYRLWKSHMIITRRLSHKGLFHVDRGESAIMHHGSLSIVNLNHDATRVDLPDYQVDEEAVTKVREALVRLFPSWNEPEYHVVACIKTDVPDTDQSTRSLNINIQQILPRTFCILPGKLTETPYLTDLVVQVMHQVIDDDTVARRPIDLIRANVAEDLKVTVLPENLTAVE
jgi:glycine/D-amino acid oxidase-like deaminating enzyme